jgi:hypothetical protein
LSRVSKLILPSIRPTRLIFYAQAGRSL